MTVIIPHQNDELKLINIQNNLMHSLHLNESCMFYKVIPLWIDVTSLFETKSVDDSNIKGLLKTYTKNIEKLILKNIYFKDNTVYIKSIIKTKENNENYIDFPILKRYIKNCDTIKDNKLNDKIINIINENYIDFEMNLRVFKMGKAIKSNLNSFSLKEEVWCKLN